MRRIVAAVSAVALAFGMMSSALPANAAAGFDSQWVTQSDYLSRAPGAPSELIQAFFSNTGTTSWVKGTSSQVDLAACLEDKVTCSAQDASDADFNDGWLSTTRYAAQDQTTVAPGGIAAFKYRIMFPATKAAGTYRLNGDLVVSSTGERIHPEGYFHQQIITGAPAASCTPTAITTTPTTATRQVGATHEQTATVTCDPPSGSTTRPAASGAQVTFVADAPVGSLNPDLSLTATTDANGVAKVTWTRANPDTDTVSVFPTAQPAVRNGATITWQVASAPISITPDTSRSQLVSGCLAYTISTQSVTTGAAASRRVLLNFVENTPIVSTGTAETTQGDKGAFFKIPSNGAAQASPTNVAYTSLTTDSSGNGTFDVCGPGGTVEFTVTPVGYLDTNSDGARNTGEDVQDTGGAASFQVSRATLTITPTTASTVAVNGQVVYQVTAVDQFGAAFTGAIDVAFVENTDDSTTTSTAAVISWVDNDTSLSTTASSGCGTASSGTTLVNAQRTAVTPTTAGRFNFAVCDATAETGTPVVWQDIPAQPGDDVRQTSEPQATGGTVTWRAAAATTAKLSPSSATNTASSESPIADNGSLGEERYTAQVVDQSGNPVIPSTTATTTVVFTVKNTSTTGNVFMTECRNGSATGATGTTGTSSVTLVTGAIAPGATATCTATITQNTTDLASVEIDKGAAGNATIDCTMTVNTTTPATYVCTQATKTWVDIGTTRAANQAATGTVVAFDKTQDFYTIQTSIGNFTIQYDVTDTYRIDGNTATYTQFELSTQLTLGDEITFRSNPAAGEVNHALTNK